MFSLQAFNTVFWRRLFSFFAILTWVVVACVVILRVQNASAVSLFDENNPDDGPVFVEMFLSQSCSSCVPAAAHVRQLAQREDVIVLAWHVDYWDDLFVANHGRWKDPYSSPDYTDRQRKYALNRPTGRIYTPQAIVNGQMETVGSRPARTEVVLAAADRLAPLEVTKAGNQLKISTQSARPGDIVYLASFQRTTQTSILGGENAGHDWQEANVVTNVTATVIDDPAGEISLALPEKHLAPDQHCAIFIQAPGKGAVRSAAYCPQS